ncbi:hypothetical protein ACETU7_22710 [Rhodococcus sp. 3Y1]
MRRGTSVEVELEFRCRVDGVAVSFELVDLFAQDRARCDRDHLAGMFVDRVSDDDGSGLEPRRASQCSQVRLQAEVMPAGVSAGVVDNEFVHALAGIPGIHTGAHMQALVDVREENSHRDSFADQPSVEVDTGDEDGVDVGLGELGRGEPAFHRASHPPSTGSWTPLM